jgi:phospholipase C
MDPITRRQFLGGTAAVVGSAAWLAACGSANSEHESTQATTTSSLPDPSKAPFDTVVVLMMENRSFDHLLGWLPGADGKQAGLSYVDKAGATHPTWPLAPYWQGWQYADPGHDWQSAAIQLNGGKCDGFLKTQPTGDQYPIGYYTEADLPVLAQLARNWTTFDHYYCALAAATWPNRFYMHSAATDVDETGLYPGFPANPTELPPVGLARPSHMDLAIWDRLKDKGVSGGYYYHSEAMTGLYASRKYDSISYLYDQFKTDAAAGKLPNVTYVDPEYGTLPELQGTSNDMHPHGSVKVGDAFIGEVYDILRKSPQWDRMVFVVNFDENGGFYDHVPPPTVRDDNVNPNPGPHPDYKQLGFRVPAMAISPFAPKKIETAGPYEHSSVLRMIEWRWGLEPMHDRDRYAKNLADALDFSLHRDAVDIDVETPPTTTPRPADAGAP